MRSTALRVFLWGGVLAGIACLGHSASIYAVAWMADDCMWEDNNPASSWSCVDPLLPPPGVCGTVLADNSNWIGGCNSKCVVKLDVEIWADVSARVQVHENGSGWFEPQTFH